MKIKISNVRQTEKQSRLPSGDYELEGSRANLFVAKLEQLHGGEVQFPCEIVDGSQRLRVDIVQR